jgi:hypothetical protein
MILYFDDLMPGGRNKFIFMIWLGQSRPAPQSIVLDEFLQSLYDPPVQPFCG